MAYDWQTATSGRRPRAIAHRGGAALAAENTPAAFAAAIAAGADAVETDVRRSADGALVCLHDADLQRLCGDPRAVGDLDLATLRRLVAGLMTVAEAIEASAPIGILLDMKLIDPTALAQTIGAVKAGGSIGRAMLGLRDVGMVAAARSLSRDIDILGLLEPECLDGAARAGAGWFRLWQGAADAERVAAIRAAGLQVMVMVGQPRSQPLPAYPPYPVGIVDGDGLARLACLDLDAIMLDDPRLLRR